MAQNNLPKCLMLLRVSRGWNQDELSRAAGTRPASISAYERGKLIPSIKMLHRLTTAMGYTLSALEVAQDFLLTLESQAMIRGSLERTLGALSLADTREAESAPDEPPEPNRGSLLDRHHEIDMVSSEVGRVASRLTSLMLTLLEPRGDSNGPGAGEGI